MVVVVVVVVGAGVVAVLAVALLFAGFGSVAADDALAVLVIVVPLAVAGSTRTTRVNVAAVAPAVRPGMVHDTVPVAPIAGLVQVQPFGAASERNVVLDGTLSVRVTSATLLGPLLVTPMV